MVAVLLILLGAVQLTISLYFLTLTWPEPGPAGRYLGRLLRACGVRGDSCRRVARTRYARVFAGVPNALVGVVWALLVVVLATVSLAAGAFPLRGPCIAMAMAGIPVSAWLTWVLWTRLRDPCPL